MSLRLGKSTKNCEICSIIASFLLKNYAEFETPIGAGKRLRPAMKYGLVVGSGCLFISCNANELPTGR